LRREREFDEEEEEDEVDAFEAVRVLDM